MKIVDYPIRAVSKLTGLSIDTLRAWERRYSAITPQRNDRGRLYSDADIQRLHLLRKAVEAGHSISQVAPLNNAALKELAERVAHSSVSKSVGRSLSNPPLHIDLEPLLLAIADFDYYGVDAELARFVSVLTPRPLIHQVAVPLLNRVGEDWHRGRLSIAQEHMISAILRNLLGAMVRLHARSNPACSLLFATPSDELHEFGILSAAMLAAGGGLGIVYLGTNLPANEIVEAARRASVRAIVLGTAGTGGRKELLKNLRQVFRKLPQGVELWVGGLQSEILIREVQRTGIHYLPNFDELEKRLEQLGARF